LDDSAMREEHPIVLSEFGGIAFSADPNHWGYSRSDTAQGFAERFSALVKVVRSLELLAGYCYTQFADTYQEANGLLRSDRTPKIPLDLIASANRGMRAEPLPRVSNVDGGQTRTPEKGELK
jgi:hypothetical protein